jgi:formate dehydrogenase maturation protein FdhE
MSVDGGISAFERLGTHLADVERECPACGARDAAEWTATGVEGGLTYRRVCTACEAEWTGRVRLDRTRGR